MRLGRNGQRSTTNGQRSTDNDQRTTTNGQRTTDNGQRTTTMENVRTEVRDNICIITIDRPKVLNALNAQTVGEIAEAFEQGRADASVKAVIVTGGGEKAFVAGADISELAKLTPITRREASAHGQRV